MEFDTVDVESGVWNSQRLALAGVEVALVGDVVDGEHGGHIGTIPPHIGWGQATRPVVGMDDVRLPVQTAPARRDIRRGQ